MYCIRVDKIGCWIFCSHSSVKLSKKILKIMHWNDYFVIGPEVNEAESYNLVLVCCTVFALRRCHLKGERCPEVYNDIQIHAG
jgi:hypothetical protein